MPLLNSAYRELQGELAENGVSVLVKEQYFELDIDPRSEVMNAEISDVSSPQLPTDCIVPLTMREQATANSTDAFLPMETFTSGGIMLKFQTSSRRQRREWSKEEIDLIGATKTITVRLRYEKLLPEWTPGNDTIQIRGASDGLGYAAAQTAIESLINRYVRPKQPKERRQSPCGDRRRIIYL